MAATRILVLNAPNLNMLGRRQPEIYGSKTLADVEGECVAHAEDLGMEAECRQSNAEHELVGWVQEACGAFDAIVVNAGAYTHTSIALLDALQIFEGQVVEVHISDIHARETFRRHSYVALRADHQVIGEGTPGYAQAIDWVKEIGRAHV